MLDSTVPTESICPRELAPNRMAVNYLINVASFAFTTTKPLSISNETMESSSTVRIESTPPETLINYVAEGLLQLRAGEGQKTIQVPQALPSPVELASFHSSQGRKSVCRLRDPVTGRVCSKLFSGQSELRRHEKSVHYRREADLVSEDLLDFRHAKYIKNFRELQELPSLTCSGCGHVFHSQRKDSIKRHISRGVCGRRQLLRAAHITWQKISVNN